MFMDVLYVSMYVHHVQAWCRPQRSQEEVKIPEIGVKDSPEASFRRVESALNC